MLDLMWLIVSIVFILGCWTIWLKAHYEFNLLKDKIEKLELSINNWMMRIAEKK